MISIILALTMLIASPAVAGKKPAPIIYPEPDIVGIYSGQSNMENRKRYGMPVPWANADKLFYLVKGKWVPASVAVKNGNQVGPSLYAIEKLSLLYPGKTIGAINCAKGGTSSIQWLPNGNLFKNCIASAAGHSVRFVNHYQGETDARSNGHSRPEYWQPNFLQTAAAYRVNLGADLPIVFVQLGPGANKAPTQFDSFRLIQAGTAALLPQPSAMVDAKANGTVVDAETVHLTAPSVQIVGHALGQSTADLLGVLP